jgi:hypothetical protein
MCKRSLVKIVKPKNVKINTIATITIQLAKALEKNARSIISGEMATIAPTITNIGGIAG